MRFVFAISRLSTNGPSYSRIRLAQALQGRGHSVTIVTFSKTSEIAVPDDVHVESVDSATQVYPKSYLGRLRMALSLRRWFARQDSFQPIDFLSSSLTGTDRIVKASGIRNAHYWIHIATSQLLDDAPTVLARIRRKRMFRRLYREQRIIGVSQGVIDDLTEIGLVPLQAYRLYNSYDVDAMKTKSLEDPSSVPQQRFILYAGRFARPKRIDLLLQAVKDMQGDIKLAMLTENSPELDDLIESHELGGKVLVLGFRDNPYPFMRAAELLVLASDREGFPNVLVEALICGTPVVATNCRCGPAEILTGQYAEWLSPPGDVEMLTFNIRRALSQGGYEIAPWLYERFAIETAVARLETIAENSAKPKLGRFAL